MTENDTVLAAVNDLNCDWVFETFQFRTGEMSFEGNPWVGGEWPHHASTVATLQMFGVRSMRVPIGLHLPTFRYGDEIDDGRLNLQIDCQPSGVYSLTCRSLDLLTYKIHTCGLTYSARNQFRTAAEMIAGSRLLKLERLVFWEHLSNHGGSLLLGVGEGRIYLISIFSWLYADIDIDMRDVSLEVAGATDLSDIVVRFSHNSPSMRDKVSRGEVLKLNTSTGTHYMSASLFGYELFDDLEPKIKVRYADARAILLGK